MRNGALTVGELIERLREFPDTCPVLIYSPVDEYDSFGTSRVTEVDRRHTDVVIS